MFISNQFDSLSMSTTLSSSGAPAPGVPAHRSALLVIIGMCLCALMAPFFMAEAAEIEFVTATTTTSFVTGTELHLQAMRGDTLPATGTIAVALASSPGGAFGSATLGGCNDSGSFSVTDLTIASNSTRRAFCYRVTTPGEATITATFTIGNTTEVATFTVTLTEPETPDEEEPDDENSTSTPPEEEEPDENSTSTPPEEDDEESEEAATTTVTFTVGGDGTGTVTDETGTFRCSNEDGEATCLVPYPIGATVTLLALPDEGSTFENSWSSGAGTCVGATTPCTITVTSGLSLTAHFDDEDGGSSSGTRAGARRGRVTEVAVMTVAEPRPRVAGEQVTVLPSAAPNTGAGGSQSLPQPSPWPLHVLPVHTGRGAKTWQRQ